MIVKLGGSLNYRDMGPETPTPITRYTVGGRSVHASDASSGVNKGTVRDMRPHSKRNGSIGGGDAYKAQPFVIKRRSATAVIPEE